MQHKKEKEKKGKQGTCVSKIILFLNINNNGDGNVNVECFGGLFVSPPQKKSGALMGRLNG